MFSSICRCWWKAEDNVGCHPQKCCETGSLTELEAHQSGRAGWWSSPRNLPVSDFWHSSCTWVSPHPVSMWVSSPRMCAADFTDWPISPVQGLQLLWSGRARIQLFRCLNKFSLYLKQIDVSGSIYLKIIKIQFNWRNRVSKKFLSGFGQSHFRYCVAGG